MAYQVVFTGDLRSGYSRRQGIEYLSQTFNLDFSRIKSLLGGTRTVVKEVQNRQQGESLVTLFWQGGWIVELVSQEDGPSGSTAMEHSGEEISAGQRVYSESHTRGRRCSLLMPKNWQNCAGLNPNALLQAGNVDSDHFMVVLCQEKRELTQDIGLKDYCTAQLKQCRAKVQQGKLLRDSAQLPDIRPAQFTGEFSAVVADTTIQYMVSVCEDGVTFYTHIFWCEQQAFEAAREEFLEILASFRIETEAPLSRVESVDAAHV